MRQIYRKLLEQDAFPCNRNPNFFTVEPRFPELDYPELLLSSQFFVDINQSYFMMRSKSFFSHQIMGCNSGICTHSVFTCTRHNYCISLIADWPRFAPFLGEISSTLAHSACFEEHKLVSESKTNSSSQNVCDRFFHKR